PVWCPGPGCGRVGRRDHALGSERMGGPMRFDRLAALAATTFALLAAQAAAQAPPPSRVPRIGYLAPVEGPLAVGFHRGLRELGYVEGKNVVIVYRSAEGRFDRLPELAAELVRENVDVIVAEVTQPSLAAKNATRTIPIVMMGPGDPVGA